MPRSTLSGPQRDSCEFCGLPLPPGTRERKGSAFCCYGCYLVDSITRGAGAPGDPENRQASWILARVLLAAFLAMGVMVFSIVLYSSAWFPSTPGETHPLGPLAGVFRWFAMAFATPAILLLGVPLLRQSVPGLAPRATPSAVNALVALGAFSAYALSLTNVLRGAGEVYFETAVMLLLLVTVGRYLEARARARAGESLRGLLALIPRTARVLKGSRESQVSVESVLPGDTVRVLAGERIPVDGEVRRGTGFVDVSLVTGESEPASTGPGELVYAGTLCADGALEVRVREARGDRLIDRMASFVEETRQRRPRLERLAERVSSWFLPAVLAVAAGTFAWWLPEEGWFRAILCSLAVLLIACPCSLGIAAPLAVSVAVQRAARRGVLVRGGEILETLARRGSIFFDKTGTLTFPGLRLSKIIPAGERAAADVLETATSLAPFSVHPLARALQREGPSAPAGGVDSVESFPGLGLAARRRGERLLMGNEHLMRQQGVEGAEALLEAAAARIAGESRLFVARGDELIGLISFRETLRPEAPSVLGQLRKDGWKVGVLTGDAAQRGEALEALLRVPVAAELHPHEKVELLRREGAAGRATVMVGDGLNDAPVLAEAGVGIALASAADLTRDSADVVLLDTRGGRVLEGIPFLLELSRSAVTRIRWNLLWSFGYNAAGVTLAAMGRIHPVLAALLMILSSASVIATSVAGKATRAARPARDAASREGAASREDGEGAEARESETEGAAASRPDAAAVGGSGRSPDFMLRGEA